MILKLDILEITTMLDHLGIMIQDPQDTINLHLLQELMNLDILLGIMDLLLQEVVMVVVDIKIKSFHNDKILY